MAKDLINKMPMKPDPAVWDPLLGACRIHTNIDLGEPMAEHLFELDPKNFSTYVLLSNIYATTDRWDDIEKVRKMMKNRELKKKPGYSWIEVNKQVYALALEEKPIPHIEEIYAELDRLSGMMKEEVYTPDTIFVLNDVEEEQKEHNL